MISLLLIFLAALIFAAFFSGSEMAYVSSDRVQIRHDADAGNTAAKRILSLYDKPQAFLTTILIGNNISNVVATSVLALLFKDYWGIGSEWAVTAVAAPILILFGEMLPKDYGRLYARPLLFQFSLVLRFLVRIISVPLDFFQKRVLPGGIKSGAKSIFVNEEEFRSLIDESARSGIVNRFEKRIIDTILDFEKIKITSVMIPLEQVPKLDISSTVGQIKKLAQETNSRMILIFEEDPALVVGMIYVFDVLFETRENLELRKFLRSPIFLPEDTPLEKAFLTLQTKRQSNAVVVNEEAEVVGVVPIEKLLG